MLTWKIKEAAKNWKQPMDWIVGSPVYWASPTGQIIEFMDKLSSLAGKHMLYKPAAAIASARRAGTTATLEVLTKYFQFFQMPVISLNMVQIIEYTIEEVMQDEEGLQIMRTLGTNMAWVLKCQEGKKCRY